LFQFYPKALSTITYTDKNGTEKTVKSNESGELALFDENGIASDVYVTSKVGETTYTGVISQETLLSKEKDAATMELYPINILQLRKLSDVEVYFKKPDGTPYTGKVIYRAGVYKNGEYAPYAQKGGSGGGITEQLGPDGYLKVTFDTTKFYTEKEPNAANLSAKDNIEIVLEVTFEDDHYYPQILRFDGNTSPADMIIFGEKIAQLIENPDGQKTPFIINQYVTTGESGEKLQITNYSGKFGPNDQFPNITLTTDIMWWGEQADEETAYAELYSEKGRKSQGQSYQTFRYPFSDIIVTRHQQVINKDTIWLGKAQSGPIHFRLYASPGSFRKSLVTRATLVNMIGVEIIDLSELLRLLENLKKMMESVNDANHDPGFSDELMTMALKLLNKISIDTGPLKMKVIPTEDPMVFETLIAVSFGNMPSAGGDPQGGGVSQVEFMQQKGYSVAPGLMDIYRLANGTYMKHWGEKAINDMAGNFNTNALYSFGGYYAGEIRYNAKTGKWEHLVKGGGFKAGGGIDYRRNVNTFLGPIPVTFTLAVGGGVEVDFKASVLYGQIPGLNWSDPSLSSVNDYLTSLRILAYLELFGGVGIDYTIVAAKIGLFGKVTIDDTTSWLNRDYLANMPDRAKVGNKLTLEGIAGIRAVLKFLFFSENNEFASHRYSHTWVFANWNQIQDYWNKHANSPADGGQLCQGHRNVCGSKRHR
jgi:hypothetical protein